MKLKGHQVKTAEVIEFRNFSKIWRTNLIKFSVLKKFHNKDFD